MTATYRGNTQVDRPALGATTAVTSLLGVTSETTGTRTIGYTRLPSGQVIGRRDNAAGTRHYLHADRLGSVLAITDQTGTLTTEYDYTPYGQTTVNPLTAGHVDQPYRYTGQHQDPTGLYKMGLRYYNPELSRWTQPDPAVSINNLAFGNTYLYVGDNPANGVDPTGGISARDVACVAGTVGTVASGVGTIASAAGLATAPTGAGPAAGAAVGLVTGLIGLTAGAIGLVAGGCTR